MPRYSGPCSTCECAVSLGAASLPALAPHRGMVPGPRCTLETPPCGHPPAELSSCACFVWALVRVSLGCEGRCLDMVHFVTGPLSFLFPSWPYELRCWCGGPSGPFQPLSHHVLPLRDFPGTVPSPEPAGLSRGSAGSPPRKPRLLAQGMLPGSQK